MAIQLDFTRVGGCRDCGDCCTFYTPFGSRTCKDYNPTAKKHCRIYAWRPKKCREYPKTPADLVARPNCGFQFVDVQGRVVKPYEDPVYAARLSRVTASVTLRK